ncbi:DsbA family protein [Nocardia cyriacigeorgica]|uniref:DsbA family protein n=1 Tax=Nocardia cyriacigeorgica TaxID=135487 RepID=UPI002454D39E|nr:thioredoxin domain-containing protein [Nocardia cyriacigeorgica]
MNTYPGGWQQPQQPQQNRRLLVVLMPFLVLVLVAAAVGIGLLARGAVTTEVTGTATAMADGSTPKNVLADGAVRVGDEDAKVTVRVVMDLQCPACKAFEEANGSVLEEAVREGTAAVEYSVITFLDTMSETEYSSRAGNASFCVASSGLDNYQSWLSEMYAKQPTEGGAGLPDSDLIDIAESAGYTDSAVAECITNRQYDSYLRTKTTQVLASGVSGTPTVYVNGAEVTDRSALMIQGGLAAVIEAAR